MEWIVAAAVLYLLWRIFFRKKTAAEPAPLAPPAAPGAPLQDIPYQMTSALDPSLQDTPLQNGPLLEIDKDGFDQLLEPYKAERKEIRKTLQKAKRFLAANGPDAPVTKAMAAKLLPLLEEAASASQRAGAAFDEVMNLDISNGVHFSDALDRQLEKFAETFAQLEGEIEDTVSEIISDVYVHLEETGQLSLYTEGRSDTDRVAHALKAISRDT